VRHFTSFGQFADYLASIKVSLPGAERRGLDAAAAIIQAEAKAEIGHYQEAAGPFAPWLELADSTKRQRRDLGYTENDPLYRDGTLRDNIHRSVGDRVAAVGVPHGDFSVSSGGREPVDIGLIAIWMELGTKLTAEKGATPPRSFLGGAAVRKTDQAVNALTGHIVHLLAGSGTGYRAND